MPSPFPGMDPFIEGQEWEDFHSRFVSIIAEALTDSLGPGYIARIEARVYVEMESGDTPSAFRADAAILRDYGSGNQAGSRSTAVMEKPVLVPIMAAEEVRETYLVIRLAGNHNLVTAIELLSPGNKRVGSTGRRKYLAKRLSLLDSSAHLIEIDLLRGGMCVPMAASMPPADYYVIVSRATRRPLAEVWPVQLTARLPLISVPLIGSDPDVPLDLQSVFDSCFERARYDRSLEYRRPLEPPLSGEDAVWLETAIGEWEGGLAQPSSG